MLVVILLTDYFLSCIFTLFRNKFWSFITIVFIRIYVRIHRFESEEEWKNLYKRVY